MKNGRWISTVYGRQWKSDEEELRENAAIVVIGLFATIIFLLTR